VIFGKAALLLVVFIVVMWMVGRLMRDRRRR
jgi:ABC-type phosphate transport system permease subunit